MDAFDTPDEEANERRRNEELQSYYRAMEQEWEKIQDPDKAEVELTAAEIRDKTKVLLTNAVPKAVAQLLMLCQHAKAENVRLKAAQIIVERALGKDNTGLVGDRFDELLKEFNKQ